MSGLGIGIGAFAGGLAQGYGLGLDMEEAGARREDRKVQRQQQEDLAALQKNVDEEFNRRVEAGQAKPEDAYKFWTQFGAPRRMALLAQQGRYQDANELRKWTDSEAAAEGTRLFASSLFKAQSGDLRGAIDEAVKAGKVKGYLDHSYKIDGEEEITDKAGNVTGYRVRLLDGDGAPVEWEVTPENVVDGIATLFNPEAAFQTHLDARAAKSEAALEVDTYGKKEAIKDRFERGRTKQAHDLKMKEGARGGVMPAEVKAAEWLAENLAATQGREATPKDKVEAHKTIREARKDPNARAALVLRVYETLAKDPRDRRPAEEKRKDAAEYVDELISEDSAEGGDGGAGGMPGLGDMGSDANPYEPASDEEYAQIPAGAVYIDPDDGNLYRKTQ